MALIYPQNGDLTKLLKSARKKVPQSARLSADGGVQKLKGQCPNAPSMNLRKASLTPLNLRKSPLEPILTTPKWYFGYFTYFAYFGLVLECKKGGFKGWPVPMEGAIFEQNFFCTFSLS